MKRFVLSIAVPFYLTLSFSVSAQELDGKKLFVRNCSACHQANGAGIPGAYPALAGNRFVTGDGKDVAAVLLKGRGGMPNFSSKLSDRDIANVLSYVRSNWGNQAPAVEEQDIASLRASLQAAQVDTSIPSSSH